MVMHNMTPKERLAQIRERITAASKPYARGTHTEINDEKQSTLRTWVPYQQKQHNPFPMILMGLGLSTMICSAILGSGDGIAVGTAVGLGALCYMWFRALTDTL